MLFMINQFRDQMPRPLVGLGHSCGAVQMQVTTLSPNNQMANTLHRANVSLMHARLFTSMIFLDPGFLKTRTPMGFRGEGPGVVNFNTWRKDVWPNRSAAASFIRKTSADWDPRTIENMIEYGFRNLPTALYPELPPGADPADPPVTLATSKHHSCLTQLRPCFDFRDENGWVHADREKYPDLATDRVRMPLYRPEVGTIVAQLPTLRPPALFIFGKKTAYSIDDMHDAALSTGTGLGGSGGMAEGRVKEVLVDGGHMFPFTAVGETGKIVGGWLGQVIERYKDQEDRWEKERAKMTKADHLRLPKRWFEVISNPFEGQKKSKL